MKQGQRNPTEAERTIARELRSFQERAAAMWLGREKEAIIAVVRALDSIAVSRIHRLETHDTEDVKRENGRFFATMGAAAALRPFLTAVHSQRGGVPWGPMAPETINFAYSYLDCCGKLTHLSRMAALEHYGLASTSRSSAGHVRIKVRQGTSELSLLAALEATRRSTPREDDPTSAAKERLATRMIGYVDTSDEWFIRYDNDMEVVSAYREEAHRYGTHFLEAEAFPDDVVIGGRSFGAWKEACDHALGRILSHIDFSTMLRQKNPGIALGNVLTIFARRADVDAVWLEAGLARDLVRPTMHALTLEVDGLDDWEQAYETPSPFYVGLGKDFVLLPCFGALNNPYFALFRHLRRIHKSDWDRAVDRREAVFRADLAEAFPEPHFLVPPHGFQLRRDDGSKLTDLDAIVVDRRSGTLAIIQLKWHDIFGRSLAERESRRRNIGKANEWVERVNSWVDGRSSAAVASALGLGVEGSEMAPLLYVVARYAARFSGDRGQDPRAAWLGWLEVQHALACCSDQDPLSWLPRWIGDQQAGFASVGVASAEFRFPGLVATLDVLPET